MGYGGLSSLVRRYNTNDYWALSRLEGSLPWETTLYVPKIIAAAIVARNPQVFGFQDLATDPPLDFEEAIVAPGTPLSAVAQAAGVSTKEIEALNPELRASRTPPKDEGDTKPYPVKVPAGKSAAVVTGIAKLKPLDPPLEKYVVRFGESIEQIAQARGITSSKIVDINAIAPGEVIRGGTVLLVPPPKVSSSTSAAASTAPVAIVPADVFVYPGRKRVFYRVTVGDTLPDVANTLKVSVDDLRRWNDVDPVARLIEGMTLQAFVPEGTDLSKVVTLAENDVRVVPVGSDDFFALADSMKGKKRIAVTAKSGETLETIGKRFGVSTTTMERINRRDRREAIRDGETIVVYVTPQTLGAPVPAQTPGDALTPEPLPPLPL
jgi:membrane-bound lytic murein transglycosylase D